MLELRTGAKGFGFGEIVRMEYLCNSVYRCMYLAQCIHVLIAVKKKIIFVSINRNKKQLPVDLGVAVDDPECLPTATQPAVVVGGWDSNEGEREVVRKRGKAKTKKKTGKVSMAMLMVTLILTLI